ncbi:hypothetical protein HAX54_043965 [Datura stramonium]|uniref:Uncharacterized protein n=1 Tax=Datura stramonium TaxID=4076 RepID=A0ABS8W1U8_DATST|nr:hypothetical protein [Datura stramonium]
MALLATQRGRRLGSMACVRKTSPSATACATQHCSNALAYTRQPSSQHDEARVVEHSLHDRACDVALNAAMRQATRQGFQDGSDQSHEDGTSRARHDNSLRILPGARRLHHGATGHATQQEIRLNGMREAAFARRYSLQHYSSASVCVRQPSSQRDEARAVAHSSREMRK